MLPQIFSLFMALALSIPAGSQPAYRLQAARIQSGSAVVVNTTADDAIVNGNCTLREAVLAMDAHLPVDQCQADGSTQTVILPAGTYKLLISPGAEDTAETGDLDIHQDMTITGAGADQTILDGNQLDRVLHIPDSATRVSVSSLSIQNGRAQIMGSTVEGGGISNSGTLTLTDTIVAHNRGSGGGGILNIGTLTIQDSSISENTITLGSGGGIQSLGSLTINDSSITGNNAYKYGCGGISSEGSAVLIHTTVQGNYTSYSGGGVCLLGGKMEIIKSTIQGNSAWVLEGGGIFQTSGTTLKLIDSTVSENESSDHVGGGIYSTGASLTIENSLITQNHSKSGGGIYVASSTITMTNSTISGNTVEGISSEENPGGGGFYSSGAQVSLNNVTISDNQVSGKNTDDKGGGIFLSAGMLTIQNSIIADNRGAPGNVNEPDCFSPSGTIISKGHNLVGESDGCNWVAAPGDKIGFIAFPLNPLLGPLSANGGAAWTHALLPGSPALDSGKDCLATDQRGVARPQGAACDIGAYEATFISIGDAAVLEGDQGATEMTFPVTLSGPSSGVITLRFDTEDGTALAGRDYVTASGVLTIPTGTTSQMIKVSIRGDFIHEPDQSFSVNLSNPNNAIIQVGSATGKIINDDPYRVFLPNINRFPGSG